MITTLTAGMTVSIMLVLIFAALFLSIFKQVSEEGWDWDNFWGFSLVIGIIGLVFGIIVALIPCKKQVDEVPALVIKNPGSALIIYGNNVDHIYTLEKYNALTNGTNQMIAKTYYNLYGWSLSTSLNPKGYE